MLEYTVYAHEIVTKYGGLWKGYINIVKIRKNKNGGRGAKCTIYGFIAFKIYKN